MNQAISRAADREQNPHCIFDRFGRQNLVGRQTTSGQLHRRLATALCDSHPVGGHGGRAGATGHRQAKRFGNTGHRAGRAHYRAGTDTGNQLFIDFADLNRINRAGTMRAPEAATVGAGTHPFTTMRAGQHRAGNQLHARHVGRYRAHQLRRHSLVATADQHHRVHRLRPNHFFGIHRHQVAQEHAGRMRKAFVQ